MAQHLAYWRPLQARGLYKQMVLICITPTWAKIIDFETRLPKNVEELTKAQ